MRNSKSNLPANVRAIIKARTVVRNADHAAVARKATPNRKAPGQCTDTEFRFTALPEKGFSYARNGTNYVLTSTKPHRRADGTMTTLLVWKGTCRNCGRSFRTTTGLTIASQTRRCPSCR